MHATVTFEYESGEHAEVVKKVLEIDNKTAPSSMGIFTKRVKNKVVTYVRHEKIGTLLATVDDIIFAEKIISSILSLKKENEGSVCSNSSS